TVSRKELAEFAAGSHENVINTLSRFRREGLIEFEGKKIVILNHETLTEISKKG
ncbi:MAG: transcriptional regulator, partial [Bacteroidetes bacterium HGW-Bacteroidetes-22]